MIIVTSLILLSSSPIIFLVFFLQIRNLCQKIDEKQTEIGLLKRKVVEKDGKFELDSRFYQKFKDALMVWECILLSHTNDDLRDALKNARVGSLRKATLPKDAKVKMSGEQYERLISLGTIALSDMEKLSNEAEIIETTRQRCPNTLENNKLM